MKKSKVKFGDLDNLKDETRAFIINLKRSAAKENGSKIGCPSVAESIGTKFRIIQQKDGSLKVECGGIGNSTICPECPVYYKGTERA